MNQEKKKARETQEMAPACSNNHRPIRVITRSKISIKINAMGT